MEPGARDHPFHLPARLTDRVRADFPAAGSAGEILRLLHRMVVDLAGSQLVEEGYDRWAERVSAAVVVVADGDVARLLQAIDDARADWRDVLVAADLARDDWAERLDVLLGRPAHP
jgi:hypothetical protein